MGWEDPLKEEMQLTPVFLLEKVHRQRRLAGCSPWISKSLTQLNTHTHTHTHDLTQTSHHSGSQKSSNQGVIGALFLLEAAGEPFPGSRDSCFPWPEPPCLHRPSRRPSTFQHLPLTQTPDPTVMPPPLALLLLSLIKTPVTILDSPGYSGGSP